MKNHDWVPPHTMKSGTVLPGHWRWLGLDDAEWNAWLEKWAVQPASVAYLDERARKDREIAAILAGTWKEENT